MRVRVEWEGVEYDMERHCHLQSGNPALQRKVFETKKCKMAKNRANQDPCTSETLEPFAQLVS
mgnify:CR=1 FL=1